MFVEVSYHKPCTAEHTAGRRHSRSSPSHSRTRSRHWNTRRTTSLQISAVHRTTVAVRDFIAELTRTALTKSSHIGEDQSYITIVTIKTVVKVRGPVGGSAPCSDLSPRAIV